jgi:hypothetical protein
MTASQPSLFIIPIICHMIHPPSSCRQSNPPVVDAGPTPLPQGGPGEVQWVVGAEWVI